MSIRIAEQGGTAFPTTGPMFHNGEESIGQQPGMTLRDYFAAKAMQGYLAGISSTAQNLQLLMDAADAEKENHVDVVVQLSYIHADAMLQHRVAKAEGRS